MSSLIEKDKSCEGYKCYEANRCSRAKETIRWLEVFCRERVEEIILLRSKLIFIGDVLWFSSVQGRALS